MSELEARSLSADVEPLPANVRSVQPGGGACYSLELLWGQWRRWYLKRFRPGYVDWMARLRVGDCSGAPHEILDPRDLKYCRNICDCSWKPADDPFAWRERIPLARWGLAEAQIFSYPLILLTLLALATYPWLAIIPLVLLGEILYFFRDPQRKVPTDVGAFISPADGLISEISEVAHDEFLGGPAVRIGIYLSIFNVHINRVPETARVLRIRYDRGKFISALNPISAIQNEAMLIGLETDEATTGSPARRYLVRQIAGQWARRIVCDLRPGEMVQRGHKFGMIKLGSRTELILPAALGLKVEVRPGQKVLGGETILARYAT